MNNQIWCLYTKTIGKKLALFTIIDGIGYCNDEPNGIPVSELTQIPDDEQPTLNEAAGIAKQRFSVRKLSTPSEFIYLLAGGDAYVLECNGEVVCEKVDIMAIAAKLNKD